MKPTHTQTQVIDGLVFNKSSTGHMVTDDGFFYLFCNKCGMDAYLKPMPCNNPPHKRTATCPVCTKGKRLKWMTPGVYA